MCSESIYYFISLDGCHELEKLSTKLCGCLCGEEEGKEAEEVCVPGVIASWLGGDAIWERIGLSEIPPLRT